LDFGSFEAESFFDNELCLLDAHGIVLSCLGRSSMLGYFETSSYFGTGSSSWSAAWFLGRFSGWLFSYSLAWAFVSLSEIFAGLCYCSLGFMACACFF
jgi:hypothetical protein